MNIPLQKLEMFGLTESEKKIITSLSKIGKYPSQIASHTGIPRSSIQYMLKKLEKKTLVKTRRIEGKTIWMLNLRTISIILNQM